MIVTLEDIKQHLKIEDNQEDDLLEGLISSVTDDISNYCHTDFREMEPHRVPGAVKLAAKLLISHYFENRDVQDHLNYRAALKAYEFLLYPYRDPGKLF